MAQQTLHHEGVHTGRDSQLSILHHPATRLPGPSLLHLLVHDPLLDNTPAIDFLDDDETQETLTYHELHRLSNNLAAKITTGISARDQKQANKFVIPVLIPQGPNLYIALLAILKAGGAFCPLNLDVPLERAKFILNDVDAKVIITTQALASRLTQDDPAHLVLVIDSEERRVPDQNTTDAVQHRQPTPQDLAYVMYTSGSTGTPKGVGVSHDAATQSLLAHDRHIPQFSRFLQFAAPTFDVSVFEIFFPFLRGKTLVTCTRSALLNDLPGVMKRMTVDACELTPSVAGSLLRKRENAPDLRLLLTIGEMLTKPVVQEFGGNHDRSSMLWGMYGPTEAAIHCTVQPAFACDTAVGNIGIPFDTVSAFILDLPEDDNMPWEFKVLPVGEVGELAVGGHQLADGYVNRPEMTAKAFIETPYGRLYRTGDKARILSDGTLECLGRIGGGQVKLRGQRMELGEVEHAALRADVCHSAVAAVINSILVLFCAIDQVEGALEAIMASCQAWLPGFMVPGDTVVLTSFPRLPSGKIDRKGLIAHYSSSQESGAELREAAETKYFGFKDEVEKQLCDVVGRTLEMGGPIHPVHSLSQAGLDSITAIAVTSALRRHDFDIDPFDILGSRNVSSLYAIIRGKQNVTQTTPLLPSLEKDSDITVPENLPPGLGLGHRSVESIYPCTPLQASMLAETVADSRAYCNWIKLRFAPPDPNAPKPLSLSAIRSRFVALVQEHDILRTGFVHHSGQFLQVVFHSTDEALLDCVAESTSTASEFMTPDFSLESGHDFLQPFRVLLLKPGDDSEIDVIVQLHHAIYDGWSWDILLEELIGHSVTRQEPRYRPQFKEVVSYYQSLEYRDASSVAEEFWAENLLGYQPPTPPNLRQEVTETSEVCTTSLSMKISPVELRRCLQKIQCGPQTVFQAALAWIWSAMVGTEDVAIGSVTSGRTIPVAGIEDTVGPCIASVPLRVNFAQVRTLKDLLLSTHAANRALLPHSLLPLAEIKRAAGIRAGKLIYDVLFVYQESIYSRTASGSDCVKVVEQRDHLETQLLVEMEPKVSEFQCRITYHADIFPHDQIRVLGDCLRELVPYLLGNLNEEVGVLQNAFSKSLLAIYNPQPKAFTGIPDLALAVERVVEESPQKEALCFAEQITDDIVISTTLTFQELNRIANKIAYHLRERQIQEGDVVGIMMEKSILLYAGILAILKTGCAYLPLLPSTPLARTHTIFQQAKVKICVTDTSTLSHVDGQLPVDFLDVQTLDYQSTPSGNVRITNDPDRLAYVIYTSGSTGIPKGVCVTQLNITSNLDVLSRIYPVKEDSRLLQSCSQAFDVSVFEIFFAWTQGMCLCSGTNDTLFEDLERSLRKLGVTHLSMTPTVASLVEPAHVPGVEFLVTAGEAMTDVVARKWGEKLYQGYGPSETTNICSVKRMGPRQVIQHLGWSFENTSTFVMFKDSTHLTPIGCLGEFCFGGDQVAQGYLDMPDLTSAKFIDHPEYGRLYRSGDIGRMLPDGSMVILGRVDEQIKLRGQRIELGEVTATLKLSDSIADCATLFLKEKDGHPADQIVSYVVPIDRQDNDFHILDLEDGLAIQVQSLFELVSSRVPGYMVPSAIIPISVLPTTASGKLDRGRLSGIFRNLDRDTLRLVSPGEATDNVVGDWTDAELKIASSVSEALGVRKQEIERWTPLVTLGLDSISAIQVSKNLHSVVGKRLPISSVLQNATVARLAKVLATVGSESKHDVSPRELVLLPKQLEDKIAGKLHQESRAFEKILPCTPLQEAMLAASSGKELYLNRMILRIHGNHAVLQKVWMELTARHGILRTCFLATDDKQHPIVQVILAESKLEWLNFDGANADDIDHRVQQQVALIPDSIDSFEPVISLAHIMVGEDRYLSFVCHHALYDGVAIERLLYEAEQLYNGISLPPPPSYDHFLHESLKLPSSTDEFWVDYLNEFQPKLTSHLDAEQSHNGSFTHTRTLDIPLMQVKEKAKELGVSLLTLMQSSWAETLACLLRTNDVCFGNVVSGRSIMIEGIEELVAPCFNTVPVRVNLSGNERNIDLMKSLQSSQSRLMYYQFTPLRRIQALFSNSGSGYGSRRLFDTLLLLQQAPRELQPDIWTLERDEGEMDVPLVCEVIPFTSGDELVIKLHILGNTLSQQVACMIADLFFHALKTSLQFPGSHVLSSVEIHQSLKDTLDLVPLKALSTRTSATETPQAFTDELWSPNEASVRKVLATLSSWDIRRIGKQTTIFQLGLDSISAVQIASSLRKLGHKVLASDVIEKPTCESLAQQIDTREGAADVMETYDVSTFRSHVEGEVLARGLSSASIEAVLPCTPLQAGMMVQFLKSGGADYFNYLSFAVVANISPKMLSKAWRDVCMTHPILRTGITPVEHDEIAFAMIQYCFETFSPEIQTFELGNSFNIEEWRSGVRKLMRGNSEEKLWAVALQQTGQGLSMHLAIHHVLYDAHSLQIMLGDLVKSLQGVKLLPDSSNHKAVSDILGQVKALATNGGQFWKQQLENVVINGFPVMTPLRHSLRHVLVESLSSSTPSAKLEQAVAGAGYTLQVVLQAAWTRVLASYLGEPSVVFGVVLSGRNTDATRRAAFPCITTLPVIAKNDESNQRLLTGMMQYNTKLYKQQHQSLTRVQQWLGLSDTKLFDTLLVYQKFDLDTPQYQPWHILDEQANADYPVSIEVEPRRDGQLGYQITFFDDVLPKEQAQILLQQFDAAVNHLALSPDGHENRLFESRPDIFSILPPEKPELPSEFEFLHQFVERQADLTPDAIALHFVGSFNGDAVEEERWTYEELNLNGNRVSQLLLPHVKTGDIVAVYFDKCPEAYFSILGILKAGCAFVALDPGAPSSRNQFIVQDSRASVLVTTVDRKNTLDFKVLVPVLGVDKRVIEALSLEYPVPSRPLKPSDVAYCLYTSGTTGTPKGCEITHDNTVQCMLAFQHIVRGHWTAESRWLQFASLHFDVSVLEQYWSWSVGITLVAAPRDVILEDLAGTISRLEITHIDLTPSLARLVHPNDVPSLCRGVFITGGEPLKQEILDLWGEKGVIYNFYGPTETTIGVTVFPQVPVTGRASNIGKQFINVGSFVLKPGTDQPVLRGAVGELCVSGRLVGKGYLHRDDLTAERFPTLQPFGERIYRTGDLVRVLHDGCFDFLGRADDQVKLRGQRLEIGEINHAIRKGVDEIKDVATLVVRNEIQHKDLLVSFIIDNKGKKRDNQTSLEVLEGPEASRLCWMAKDACRSKLPGYMIPTYVLQLPYIPLSANNKAEIKQLRRFFGTISQDKLVALASSSDNSTQKLTPIGETIASAVTKLQGLATNSVTPDSSIFELGIDSISVLRLSRALKRAGLPQASPSLLLSHPRIGDLSRALEGHKAHSNAELVAEARQLVQACAHKNRLLVCKAFGITPDEIEYIAPCSPLQQGMLSRPTAYFNTFQFILRPETDVSRLRSAFERTVDAVPILRSKFLATSDGFAQVALKHAKLAWTEVQAEDITSSSDTDQLSQTREAWIAKNQELIVCPMEVVHIQQAKTLALHIFHALYDANSLQLILNRIADEYWAVDHSQESNSVPSFLDALCHGPLQNFGTSRQFWVEHLQNAAIQSHQKFSASVVLSTMFTEPFAVLESLAAKLGVTHQAIIQAAWVSVLAKLRSLDPTIGIIVSGQALDLDGAERVVGPLFNTLPFHARLLNHTNNDSPSTWSSLIRQCHDFNTSALAFQHTPLRDIQKWCSQGKPLFDTLFSFQREDEISVQRSKLWHEIEAQANADYALALEATLCSGGQLRLQLVSQREAVDDIILEVMKDELKKSFEAMASDPDQAVGTFAAIDTTRAPSTHDGLPRLEAKSVIAANFEWSGHSAEVRRKIAALAGVSEDTITPATSIFELGLDSIDVIKLSAKLKDIKTHEIMKAQTIGNILELIEVRAAKKGSGAGSLSSGDEEWERHKQLIQTIATNVLNPIPGQDLSTVAPTTPLQEAMVAEMIDSDFQLYFNHDVLELSPAVEISRLMAAWRQVVVNSAILRTVFVPVDIPTLDSAYCQVTRFDSRYLSTKPPFWFETTLQNEDGLPRACEEARLRAHKGAGLSDLFQLTYLTVTGSRRRFLVLSLAHALYDGWSLGLLHRDVRAAYDGNPPPQRYNDCYKVVNDIMLGNQSAAAEFWSGFLDGAVPTMISSNGHSTEKRTHRSEVVSASPASKIINFCKTKAVTLQALGQACWASLLASRTGSLDVTFGVVVSGRDSVALEEAMFPTMNTVAVRSVLHGTVSSWLRYTQDNISSIARFQHFGLRQAQKIAKSNGPLFNTLFILQRQPPTTEGSQNVDVLWKSIDGSAEIEYPVCVEIEMTDGGLVWRLACDGRYIPQSETHSLLGQLDNILNYLLSPPDVDVLVFSGREVSICGLPLILPTSQDAISATTVVEPESPSGIWTATESTIREVLSEVSGVPAQAIIQSHSIYHLGLDSVSAIKASSALRKRGIVISFREMLKAKSITEMAKLVLDSSAIPQVGAVQTNSAGSPLALKEMDIEDLLSDVGINMSNVEMVMPATPMQVHLLSVWQNTKGAIFYPEFKYEIKGKTDLASIVSAWNNLVAEQAILRTTFVATSSRELPILQAIMKSQSAKQATAVLALPSKPKKLFSRLKRRFLPGRSSTPWISCTPRGTQSQPFTFLEAKVNGENNWALRLRIHHALYDAVSLPALMQRFAELLRGDKARDFDLHSDFEKVVNGEYSLEYKTAQQGFWVEYLKGAKNTPWQFGMPLPSPKKRRTFQDITDIADSRPLQSRAWTRCVQRGAIRDVNPVLQRCKANGVGIQAVFLASYARFLSHSQQKKNDVVFGIYLANRRDDDDAQRLTTVKFPTLRLVPLRVRLPDQADLWDVAAKIQEDIHAISSGTIASAGLWEVEEWTGVTVDSFVNFLGSDIKAESKSDGKVGGGETEKNVVKATGEGGDVEQERRFNEEPEELKGNLVRGSYKAPIDIEAALEDGGLTIGVFGPGERLGEDAAGAVIKELVKSLEELVRV
ncbi:non-ribosomal peptide synthetase [Podospora australis]|uniref:Non-ribosomal peptide synthetase n=1 Tax=Podospora australis TaxID=1536484 RepID=A0AAN7AGG5_9PEZI|nr:non-ribosomal peptide synthetase [Podospora australis]